MWFPFGMLAHIGLREKKDINNRRVCDFHCVCLSLRGYDILSAMKCLVYVCRGGSAKHQLHAVATVWSAAHQAVDRRWNAGVRGECQHGLPVTHTGIYHSHSLA